MSFYDDVIQRSKAMAMAKALAEARRNSLAFRMPKSPADSTTYTVIDISLKIWDVLTGLLDMSAAIWAIGGAKAAATVSLEALEASEAAAQASALAAGGTNVSTAMTVGEAIELGGPLVAYIGLWVALGSPYLEAKQQIAQDHVKRGVAQGVLIGAYGWAPQRAKSFLARQPQTANNVWIPGVTTVAMQSYRMGFYAGYKQGRDMSQNQRAWFWKQFANTLRKSPVPLWRNDWQGDAVWDRWFWSAGGVFITNHLKS
jgi:hypothetical protein